MVLEVTSPSSLHKDTVVLRDLYWAAGIREYWLVDVRADPLQFDVLRRGKGGYLRGRKTAGWVRSTVFANSFRLSQQTDRLGYPEYTLAVR